MTGADVFIVDDNHGNLALLAEVLKSAGFGVRAADGGRRALLMLEALAPDLIMLDIQMPGMGGFELCARIKAIPSLRSVPVIFISALDELADKVEAFRAGGVDYVTKPFQPEEVIARVETHVELYKLQRELARKNEQLVQKTDELVARNEELEAARQRTDRVFSMLTELLPGVVLDGRYKLGIKLGAGGYGAVYQATHLGLEREVAVKVLRPVPGDGTPDTPEKAERLRLEGVSACRIDHPNAISVLDFGVSSEGVVYLVMELLEGETLADEIHREGVLSTDRCAEILGPVCGALAAAHEAGVVHRDIKPENIFLHRRKGAEVVKVLDFGIAKIVGWSHGDEVRNLTVAGELVGTPYYISPERYLEEPYDGRADVYSLGVMLYEMLSGRLPFGSGARGAQTFFTQVMKDPVPLENVSASVPGAVRAVVMKALSRDPNERPTARKFGEVLHAGAEGVSDGG